MQRRGYRLWLAAATAVSIAACSASGEQSPTAGSTSATPSASSASTSGPPPADEVVGEVDSGTQVLLRPGQRLRVELGADSGPLQVSAGGVLDAGDPDGGYPTGRPLTTVLTAVAPGEVSLSSASDAACLHESPPCGLPQRMWTLSVTVAAG